MKCLLAALVTFFELFDAPTGKVPVRTKSSTLSIKSKEGICNGRGERQRALTLQLNHKTNNNKCILYSKAVKISQFIDID